MLSILQEYQQLATGSWQASVVVPVYKYSSLPALQPMNNRQQL